MQILFILLMLSVSIITQTYYQMAGNADWQEAYLINNSGYDLEIKAKIVGISNINDLVHVKMPIYQQTWISPKKVGNIGSVITLNKLDPLHDVTARVLTHDMSKLPQWLQTPYPISIKKRNRGDILLIFVSHRADQWVINYKWVHSIQIAYDSPSGYNIVISQR